MPWRTLTDRDYIVDDDPRMSAMGRGWEAARRADDRVPPGDLSGDRMREWLAGYDRFKPHEPHTEHYKR